MNEPVKSRELLLHLLSMTVQASDTTAQLYREIEKITNGISATLQSESHAEYINNATYDYAIFCDGEMVADVEGDMLLDEMTAETVKDFLQAVNPNKVITIEQVKEFNEPYSFLTGGKE
jgi:hypothetical protein